MPDSPESKLDYLACYEERGKALIPNDIVDDLWHELSSPQVQKHQFAHGFRIWAGLSAPPKEGDAEKKKPENLSDFDRESLEYPASDLAVLPKTTRDELGEVAKAAGELIDKIDKLNEYSFLRLSLVLGADPFKISEDPRPYIWGVRERAHRAATHIGRQVRTGPYGGSHVKQERRDALLDLAVIWRWANGKATFGTPFKGFASLAMACIFGEEAAEADLDRDVKNAVRQFRAAPDGHQLHHLRWIMGRD